MGKIHSIILIRRRGINYLCLILLLIFTQTINAKNYIQNPTSCPSISSLITVGVEDADNTEIFPGTGWGGWTAKKTFGTDNEWTLLIFSDNNSAKNKADAVKTFNRLLTQVAYVDGPYQTSEMRWVCSYTDTHDIDSATISAMTLTPAFDLSAAIRTYYQQSVSLSTLIKNKRWLG